MPQMTTAQARVIDPILTEIAQGYKHPAMVGSSLFPVVPVGRRGGTVLSFGKEDFMTYATGRAPGSNTKRVQFGYQGAPYALLQEALEGMVPFEIEEESGEPGVDMASMSVRKVQNIIYLSHERKCAALATNAALYANENKLTLSGTGQWSHADSDPIKAVETAKDAVRAKIGLRPNTMVIGAAVFAGLKTNKAVIERTKYTGRDVPTPEILASLFDVDRVMVGDAITASDAGVFSDVWGKFAVLAYTDTSGIQDMGSPSYGYTYRLRGYPVVEQGYYDNNAKSMVYPVTDELAPVLAAADAGFLFSAAVA